MEELIKTCRTCLNGDGKLFAITASIESNCQILDYFRKYLQINMSESDSLPSSICLVCLNKLLEVKRFFIQCQDSENYLRLKLEIPLPNSKGTDGSHKENEQHSSQNEKPDDTAICEAFETIESMKEEEYLQIDDLIEADSPSIDRNVIVENNDEHEHDKDSVKSDNFENFEILEEYADEITLEAAANPIEVFKCNECRESFKYIKNLEFHVRIFHSNESKRFEKIQPLPPIIYESTRRFNKIAFTCRICQRKFAFRKNLNIHLMRHLKARKENNESCVCSVCGKKFDDQQKLKKHIYRHSQNTPSIPCPICNKIFKAKYHLQIHMHQHTGAKPFECDVCHKSFVSPSSLRLHKILHEGKKVECPVCDTKLAAKAQLKIHMRMHTDERPYACSQCPKRYKQLCALKVHIATHSGIKSVQCDECSACFYSKNHLLSHKIKMHRPKRFHCSKCPKQYPTPFQMKSHLLSVHKLNVKDVTPYELPKTSS